MLAIENENGRDLAGFRECEKRFEAQITARAAAAAAAAAVVGVNRARVRERERATTYITSTPS